MSAPSTSRCAARRAEEGAEAREGAGEPERGGRRAPGTARLCPRGTVRLRGLGIPAAEPRGGNGPAPLLTLPARLTPAPAQQTGRVLYERLCRQRSCPACFRPSGPCEPTFQRQNEALQLFSPEGDPSRRGNRSCPRAETHLVGHSTGGGRVAAAPPRASLGVGKGRCSCPTGGSCGARDGAAAGRRRSEPGLPRLLLSGTLERSEGRLGHGPSAPTPGAQATFGDGPPTDHSAPSLSDGALGHTPHNTTTERGGVPEGRQGGRG